MRIALLALTGAVFAGNAFATTSPIIGDFNVRAEVAASCMVTGHTDIDFGSYDPTNANFTTDDAATGSINVRCTRGTVIHLALNEGVNSTGGNCIAPARRMKDSANFLNYAIYLDAAHTTAWGCGAATQLRTANASNVAEVFTTYGVIPAGQNVASGSYTDKVTYTVTF